MKKLIVILSAFLLLSGCSRAEESVDVPEIKEPEAEMPIEEPEPDRIVDFIAVGDNLIHGAIYYDSEVRHQGYEFDELYEEIKPMYRQLMLLTSIRKRYWAALSWD